MANHLATDALRRNFPSLASLMPISNDGVSFRIMAEGPTDLLHLEAALDYLRKSGGFLDVRPRFQNFLGDVGDSELWETLLRIAKADVNELTIGVFDCDSPAFMKKTSLVPGGNIQLGRGSTHFVWRRLARAFQIIFASSRYIRDQMQL